MKILLDQLIYGLKTLGLGKRMSTFPNLFRELFVAADSFDNEKVKACLQLASEESLDERSTVKYLLGYIQEVSHEELEAFLIYATGAPCIPDFGFGKTTMEVNGVDSIFALTCLRKVTLPRIYFNLRAINIKTLQSSCISWN